MARLLSSLPVGALVKDTNTKYNGTTIIWQILEHNHDGQGTTTLDSRDIIMLKCFDAKEASNSDSNRKNYGNNRYLHSNLLQWLNSNAAAGAWYTAQHGADAPPNNANVWQENSGTGTNPYESEAGFLTNFSADLRNALQTVTKVTAKNTVTDGGGYESVSSKIFLTSNTEVGLANENGVAEGTIYALYSQDSNKRKKNIRDAAAKGNYSGGTVGSPWYWWLRTPSSGFSYRARIVYTDGTLNSNSAFDGRLGVAPGLCILSSLKVSDAADSDGCYVLQWNSDPSITTDSTDLGDKNAGFTVPYTINDADGDAVSAVVKLDGTTVDTKASVVLGQAYTYEVTTAALRALSNGAHTLSITATDSNGGTATLNITFNRVSSTVTLSGSDGDLGNKWQLPEITYQVGDSGQTQVTVTESLDGTQVRSFTAQLDTDIVFDMSDWDSLSSEQSHTIVIHAVNEDGNTATRTWTFTKLYGELKFYTVPVPTDAAAKKINVVVNYEKTGNPTLRVEVTNEARAVQATWEDATAAVTAGEAYEFTNEPASASDYGIAVRITLTKSATTERVYVNSLGFSFV